MKQERVYASEVAWNEARKYKRKVVRSYAKKQGKKQQGTRK